MVSRPYRPTPPPPQQTMNQMRSAVTNEFNKAVSNRPSPMPEPPRPPVKNVSPQRPTVMGSPDKVMPTKAGPQIQRGVDMMNNAMNNAQRFTGNAAQNLGNKVKGFFKKGGKVAAKAPVKKAAGGKVTAKGRKK